MNLIDSIELDMLAETGDVELAEQIGFAVRVTCDAVTDMLAMICGLGPDFTTHIDAAIG